jgi:YVTN family beta-propeller protein
MRRGGAFTAALLALASFGIASPLHAGTILVLSQTAARLTALDSETHDRRGSSLALAPGPANLVVSPDGQRAYVAHADSGMISVVDLAAWQVSASYAAPGSPFGLALAGADRLYVGDWNGESVHELDAANGAVLRSAKIGKAPAHLVATPNGRQLLAVAREENTVTILDVATLQARATLAVERAPFALAVAPDGSHAVVANAQAGSVSTVDLATATVTASTRVGAMPYGVAFTPGGVAVVSNQQSGTVAVLAADTELEPAAASRLLTIRVGSYPEGVAVSGDDARAYVANWFSDDLSVVDLVARRETARISLPAGPRAVAVVAGSFGR